jgi:hypothetical protein
MRLGKLGILALLCVTGLAADDPVPVIKSVVARDAIEKRYSLARRAEQEYRSKLALADKQLLTSLDQAIREAMGNKDIDEASHLNALRKQTAEHLAAEQSQTPGPAITGTRWNWWNNNSSYMDFKADGVITCTGWGSPGKWAPVSDNTVDVLQPDKVYVRVTFTADLQNSLWVQTSGGHMVVACSRVNTP